MSAMVVARRAVAVSAKRVASSPSGLVSTAAFYLMVTAVLAALWKAAAGANDGELVGYSAVALVWYVATSEVVTIPLSQRLIEEVGDDIKLGALETEMLRPASLLLVRIASQAGAVGARLGACVVVGVTFALLVGGAPPSGPALVLAVPAVCLALLLNLVTQHAFASVAFWIRDATAIWFLYQKLIFVVGGMLLPLEILPDGLELLARWLPFMAMAYVPARLASGHFEPELMLIQVGWLVVAFTVTSALFRVGQRRLVEVAP